MIKGAISKIESFGLLDGPGIRTVIFLSGCKLRCKYCHNPEMQIMKEKNYTPKEVCNIIKRNKAYFKTDGGVTFSGGEALLQSKFLISTMKRLKKENINICLDTAGVGNKRIKEILKYVDIIIFDVKHTDESIYKELTGYDITSSLEFLKLANSMNKKFWVRQVIIPDLTDDVLYIKKLSDFIHANIKNVLKIEFLPYHKMGDSKYEELGILNFFKDKPAMDAKKCEHLYQEFIKIYNKEN